MKYMHMLQLFISRKWMLTFHECKVELHARKLILKYTRAESQKMYEKLLKSYQFSLVKW